MFVSARVVRNLTQRCRGEVTRCFSNSLREVSRQAPQIQQLRQYSSPEINAQALIFSQTKIVDNQATNELMSSLDDWMKSSKDKPVSAVETMLENMLESLLKNRHVVLFKSGEMYVRVVKSVLTTVDTEYSRQMLVDHLQQQTYSSLSHIHHFAVEQEISWLVEAVCQRMQSYIPHMTFSGDLVTGFSYLKKGFIPNSAALNLEARTKAMENELTAKNIIKILHILALIKYRSTNFIGFLLYRLQTRPELLSEKQISNLFFTASTLMITSPRMLTCLEVLSAPMLDSGKAPPTTIVNIIMSMGKMKWYNPQLLNSLSRKIENPNSLSVSDFSKIMTTCSVIGFLPDNIRQAVVHQLKAASQDINNVQCYLDLAWSLLVFDIKSEAICRDLLTDDRINELTANVPAYTAESNCSKLLNIFTAAMVHYRMEMPALLKDCVKKQPTVSLLEVHNEMASMLVECLKCNAAYIERGIWYPTGNIIDFRYLLNTKTGEVLPPGKYQAPYELNPGRKLQLSPNMKWVALFGNTHHHMTTSLSGSTPPEGRRRLAEAQLNMLGYHTVVMSVKEFTADPDRERKLKWLQEKISLS